MTKEEIFVYLSSTKILCTSTEETAEVQKKLFKLGIEWGVFGQAVDEDVFLLFISNNRIEFTHDIGAWVRSKKKQIEPSEILLLEPKFDSKTLQPFDKVLVRDCNTEKWRARFFDRREECGECEYGTTCNCFWAYCIPYNEETEYLHGTANEAPEFYRI